MGFLKVQCGLWVQGGVLVAFLGSSGVPVRVLTASQVGPSASRGKAQGILEGPVSPQGRVLEKDSGGSLGRAPGGSQGFIRGAECGSVGC